MCLTPQQRSSRCILQPQPTEQANPVKRACKTRHVWVSKVIHKELYKCDSTNKWHMHNLESVWDFEIKSRSLNLDQMASPCDSQQKKKTCRIVNLTVPADHRVKLIAKKELNAKALLYD